MTRLSGSGNAWLAGWADWNDNGFFTDPGELIVNGSVSVGSNTFSNIAIPVGAAVGVPINMRFRLYNSLTEPAGLAPLAVSPSGRSNGGEVEDQSIQSIPLAVLLAAFSAAQQGDAVLLTWETATELNNAGFNLYRGTSTAGPDRQLNETLIPSQAPGSSGGFVYTWEDRAGLTPGTTYFYWVEDVDIYGTATMHGPVSVDFTVPTAVQVNGLEASPVAGGTLPLAGALLAGALLLRRRRA